MANCKHQDCSANAEILAGIGRFLSSKKELDNFPIGQGKWRLPIGWEDMNQWGMYNSKGVWLWY